MAKRPVSLYDFKAFGAAIKAARNEYGESRKTVSDALYIFPRYLANIENKGQQPSLQVFYELVTCYHISVDLALFSQNRQDLRRNDCFSRYGREIRQLPCGASKEEITGTASIGKRYPFRKIPCFRLATIAGHFACWEVSQTL